MTLTARAWKRRSASDCMTLLIPKNIRNPKATNWCGRWRRNCWLLHTEIKKICAAINELRSKVGKPKREVTPPEFDDAYCKSLEAKIGKRLHDALDTEKHQE